MKLTLHAATSIPTASCSSVMCRARSTSLQTLSSTRPRKTRPRMTTTRRQVSSCFASSLALFQLLRSPLLHPTLLHLLSSRTTSLLFLSIPLLLPHSPSLPSSRLVTHLHPPGRASRLAAFGRRYRDDETSERIQVCAPSLLTQLEVLVGLHEQKSLHALCNRVWPEKMREFNKEVRRREEERAGRC